MPATLILAKNISEANAYAKAVGLPRFSYRAVLKAGSIRGVRRAEVHLLSSFFGRIDRHAIMAALRQAKTLDVYYVDLDDFPDIQNRRRRAEPEPESAPEIPDSPITIELLDEAWEENFHREAARLSALVRPESEAPIDPSEAAALDEAMDALEHVATQPLPEPFEQSDDESLFFGGPSEPSPAPVEGEGPAQASEPAKSRRRSRCKDCEELHYSDAPCPLAPDADPHASFFR